MWWTHGDLGWFGWSAMTLGMLAFWGLVVWAILALVRRDERLDRRERPAPEEILAARFARGEIDAAEYHLALGVIRGAAPEDEPAPGARRGQAPVGR